jgi:hypothetical protein
MVYQHPGNDLIPKRETLADHAFGGRFQTVVLTAMPKVAA